MVIEDKLVTTINYHIIIIEEIHHCTVIKMSHLIYELALMNIRAVIIISQWEISHRKW